MRCRYCGAANPDGELRCSKCQRRLSAAPARPAPDTYPIIETAAAPALDLSPRAVAEAPRLEVASNRPAVSKGHRSAPPVQPALFPYREPLRVVVPGEHRDMQAPAAKARAAESPRMLHKPKTASGQAAFNFDAPPPPSKPFSKEMDRRSDYPVAPLQLRAMAAMFDAGLVVGLTALFLLSVRFCLGALPLGTPFYFSYAAGMLLIAGAYKMLFCMFGQVTLGLQGAHLKLVSFDGHRPTPGQRFVRMFSGWVSLASAGMGVLWALADQESLSWHDHISQTFLTHYPPEED
ncbi:MAG: RDD family protein [Acidobacteria bacterium]|nr:RDD family protein [Acidobacteriota bacterium]